MAQSVECLTSAQVMVLWLVSSNPAVHCLLPEQSPLQILCPPLFTPSPLEFSQKINKHWGTWVAQSVEHPTSAQVTISRSVSSSPGSGLTTQSLEPASDSVSPSLSAPPMLMLCLSLSLNNK